MARTTPIAVQGILTKDYDPSVNIQPFIDTATVIIDRVIQCAVRKGTPLTDVEAELVERWLSAHCYSQSDKPYIMKNTGVSSSTFVGQTSMGFESTLYGQTAMNVDPSGCLSIINRKSRIRLKWMGKRPGNQLDQDDRWS